MPSAHFVYIADVYCPWCFGFAPIMRKLSKTYPQFPVHVIGGNLISRPITLAEDAASSPGLVDFWHEVEQTTHRSLEGAIKAVEDGRDVRMFSPAADEILVALKKLVPNHELEQLIELEDLFYGQGRDLFTQETLKEIATNWKIDVINLQHVLNKEATAEATEKNLAEASELMGEITSYPSVLLVRGNQVDAVSRGYVHFETVDSRMKSAMQDLGIEVPQRGLYCSRHGGCTLHRH